VDVRTVSVDCRPQEASLDHSERVVSISILKCTVVCLFVCLFVRLLVCLFVCFVLFLIHGGKHVSKGSDSSHVHDFESGVLTAWVCLKSAA
jgi:hypothetical protein